MVRDANSEAHVHMCIASVARLARSPRSDSVATVGAASTVPVDA